MYSVDTQFTLLVIVSAYNHRLYIEDALKGIIMQKTTFPFIALVTDDCSTDGTADIIRKYEREFPSIVRGIYHEKNCYDNPLASFKELEPWVLSSRYVALCEGDDFWTDPLKIQKQYDFMESHLECTLCFHNAIEHWEDGSKPDALFSRVEDRQYSYMEIFKDWRIPTASSVMRSSVWSFNETSVLFSNPNWLYGDIIWFLYCASKGTVWGLKDVMSVYRRSDAGITRRVEKSVYNDIDVNLKICNHFMEMNRVFQPVFGNDLRNICLYNYLKYSAQAARVAVDKKNVKVFFHMFFRSLPVSIKYSFHFHFPVFKYALCKISLEVFGINLVKVKHFLLNK